MVHIWKNTVEKLASNVQCWSFYHARQMDRWMGGQLLEEWTRLISQIDMSLTWVKKNIRKEMETYKRNMHRICQFKQENPNGRRKIQKQWNTSPSEICTFQLIYTKIRRYLFNRTYQFVRSLLQCPPAHVRCDPVHKILQIKSSMKETNNTNDEQK